MSIAVIGSGSYGPACTWQIDWDNVAKNIAITVNATQASAFFVEVTAPGVDVLADCVNGPASGVPVQNESGEDVYKLGDIINAGRSIVIGPGSLIGKTTPVTSIAKSALFSVATRWTP